MAPLPARPPLRCFVAIAFGHKDTDVVYHAIKKALKSIRITTRRVDKINHNDDIDDRIIHEIESADLVIADLTYARPSVYFEAGYAQRAIPVVYTVRSDHFTNREDDPNGNLQVHFDLKMRNIVAWPSPSNQEFLRKLKSRVTKVIAPRLQQKQLDLARRQRIADFDRLSLHDKRVGLVDTAFNYFRNIGYKLTNTGREGFDENAQSIHSPSQLTSPAFLAVKTIGTTFNIVSFQFTSQINKRLSTGYQIWLTYPAYDYHPMFKQGHIPKCIKEDIIICSVGSGGLNRIRRSIPQLHTGDFDSTLACDSTYTSGLYKQSRSTAPRHITFHVFESATKLVTLAELLKERFPKREV